MKKVFALLSVTLLIMGCGADQARPTINELVPAVQKIDEAMPASEARCHARALHESELTNDALRGFMDDESPYAFTEEEQELLSVGGELWKKFQKCGLNH